MKPRLLAPCLLLPALLAFLAVLGVRELAPRSIDRAPAIARPAFPSRLFSAVLDARVASSEAAPARPLDEFIATLASAGREDREFILDTLLPAWVACAPENAARAVLDLADENLREPALERLARLWAGQDSAAALAWADGLPFADERETALIGVCRHLATRSLPDAVSVLAEHLPGDRPIAALEDLAQIWADADLESARSWVLATAPGPRRDGLLMRIVLVEALIRPAAASLAVADMPAGEGKNEAAIAVLHQWARHDLYAASAWVADFAPGSLRDRALAELRALGAQGYAVR